MTAQTTEYPESGVIRWTFTSTEERDAFITRVFPERTASDTPGLYELPGRDTLGVHLLAVSYGASCVCSYGASGSHTINCLNYGGRRVDTITARAIVCTCDPVTGIFNHGAAGCEGVA